jgi:hypothetical protein
LAATKGEDRRHAVTVVHDDARVERVAMADYGSALPHDLAHVVVESMFGLPFGFWGLVAAGASFRTVNRAAGGPPALRSADPLIEGHLSELMVAEALVNLFYAPSAGGEAVTTDYLERARAVCEEHGRPLPDALTAPQVAEVRRSLEELNRRWQETAVGDTLYLDFPDDHAFS